MSSPTALLDGDWEEGKLYGLLAEFDTPAALFHACERMRDSGLTNWDAHTPFPVHGLDKAMGLRRSPLPFIVLGAALSFAVGGFLLQYWVHSMEYPLIISGKPYFTWQAYVPVTFELGVLGGALGAVGGMFALNRLSMHNHPLFTSDRFERASDDRFFISVQASDPRFAEQWLSNQLKDAGALSVERITA